MNIYSKKILLLSIMVMALSACADKTNGKYHSKYSFHPYYTMYADKMSNAEVKPMFSNKRFSKKNFPPQKEHFVKRKKAQNPFNVVDFYPSNVPAKKPKY